MTDMRDTTPDEVDRIARAAANAAATTTRTDGSNRADWLRTAADALDDESDALVVLADEETGLGDARLRGEVGRTTGQLRLFADVLDEGSYLEVVIDHGNPSATPPRPDLRRMLRPVGPVAVFAASNFPFAFSVAGGDTASALAVGCPVVVVAHPGHPRTSERVARILRGALTLAGAPEDTVALVHGREAGVALLQHPAVTAASFTGSVAGGRALHAVAAGRPDPIPFYGELGSINPVVVTPGADAARGSDLAAGLAGSFQLGVGQFCTKPGLVFLPAHSALEPALADHLGDPAPRMLTDSILDGFRRGLANHLDVPGVTLVAGHASVAGDDPVRPAVLATDLMTFREHTDTLLTEVFGPVTLLVRYDDLADVSPVLSEMDGSLTGTLHHDAAEDVGVLVAALTDRCGRVLFGGWPTGVAVTWAQHHGGPWPATTSQHTSVGATAVRRFQRPVVFQDAPAGLLPTELRDDATHIPRRLDGVLHLPVT